MKLPDSDQVHNAFSNVEKNFDSSISFVSTEKSPTFSEYHSRLQSVVMELTQIFGELQPLTPTKPARGDIGLYVRRKEWRATKAIVSTRLLMRTSCSRRIRRNEYGKSTVVHVSSCI